MPGRCRSTPTKNKMKNPLINKILADAEIKSARYTKLLEGGNDMTEAETTEAAGLAGELKGLKLQVRDLYEADQAVGEFKSLLSNPNSPFVLGGKPQDFGTAEVGKDGKVEGIKGIDKDTLNSIATKSYTDSWMEYMDKGMHGMSEGARKALAEGADGSGGFLVPEQMQQMLVQKTATPTRVWDRARQFTTGRDHLSFPTNIWASDDIYTSPIRLTKTGEVPADVTTALQTDPTFGIARIQIYTYMVNGEITKDFIEDSMFDMMGFVASKYQEAANILKDYKAILGSGIGDVVGLLANPGGSVGGHTQPLTVNLGSPMTGTGIVNLAYKLPEQYDENAVFIFNKVNTQRTIAGLKDSSNRFLFSGENYGDTGIASARPKELLGYQYVRSGLMPDAVDASDVSIANAYPIIFGDMSGYYAIERVGLAIQVLQETKAKVNKVELVGRLRIGGQPVEDWKFKVGKIA